jgi:tetratricopeptide (TPR) repeat protein
MLVRRSRANPDAMTGRTALPALLLSLTLLGTLAHATEPQEAPAPVCDRTSGNLTRYLLCLELQVRRPVEQHARYYRDLERIELAVLDRLPGGGSRRRGNIARQLYHAARPDTAFVPVQTLVDALDWRRQNRSRRLGADCDVFSLINAGISERYFGTDYPHRRVIVVRTRHDHVVNAFRREGRLVAALETEDGTVFQQPPAVLVEHSYFRPMSEADVEAMYLAHVALALARDDRDRAALTFIDEALRLNPGEYVANAARALILLLAVAAAPDRPTDGDPWCAGPASAALLDSAAQSATEALRIDPGAVSAHSLLGKIRLHQCSPERAQPHLERAAELGGDPLDLYYLGLVLSGEASWDGAIRAVRRGRKRVRALHDRRYEPLRVEMEFLLAQAYAQRARRDASAKDLRKAMRMLDAVAREWPEDAQVLRLEQAIERLDHRLGPVRREFGIPRSLGRRLYQASLDR